MGRLLLACLLLAACSNREEIPRNLYSASVVPHTPTPTLEATGASVLKAFQDAGLTAIDVKPGVRAPDTPLPNSYTEYLVFVIPALGDKGGQIFTCDTKQNCDALSAYFRAFQALAGPYVHQSSGGRVVIQLNSGLEPAEAARFAGAIKPFP
jgi:hypothetical protein